MKAAVARRADETDGNVQAAGTGFQPSTAHRPSAHASVLAGHQRQGAGWIAPSVSPAVGCRWTVIAATITATATIPSAA
jgi:hypothetical protein